MTRGGRGVSCAVLCTFLRLFDVISVLSVKNRHCLDCLFLLHGPVVVTMPFPFQRELLWPTQGYF